MSDAMTEAESLLNEIERLAGRTITHSRKEKDRIVSLISNRLVVSKRNAYEKGRKEFKVQVSSAVNSCLDRDPTLQKLAANIEEMS